MNPLTHLLITLQAMVEEQRECAAQCIHAPKAKALYTGRATELQAAISHVEGLLKLADKAQILNVIVEGVRNKRWAAEGERLRDTPEWCAFYLALKATEART